MKQPTEIARITHVFPNFLGLRLVPVGLWFLVVGAASPVVGRVPTVLQAVLAIVAVAAIVPVHRWYRGRFGVVEPERARLGRNWTVLAGLVVAAAIFAVGTGALGGTSSQVLLLVLVFFLVTVLFAVPRTLAGSRLDSAIVAGVGVLGAALLLRVGLDLERFNYLGALFSILVGLILCITGWIEHRSLVRTLGPGTDDSV